MVSSCNTDWNTCRKPTNTFVGVAQRINSFIGEAKSKKDG
jgi:hypothetical protein